MDAKDLSFEDFFNVIRIIGFCDLFFNEGFFRPCCITFFLIIGTMLIVLLTCLKDVGVEIVVKASSLGFCLWNTVFLCAVKKRKAVTKKNQKAGYWCLQYDSPVIPLHGKRQERAEQEERGRCDTRKGRKCKHINNN